MDQESLIKKLSSCIDLHKVIKLQMEWLDGKSESVLFEPYLIGESPVSAWTFIYGMVVEKNKLTSFPVPFIVSIEETSDIFSVEEKNKLFLVYYFENNKSINNVPDIDIYESFDIKEEILYNRAKYRVINYYDEILSKDFKRIKRKKWDELYFELIGEWSQSPMHGGDLYFIVKSTTDQKYWALFLRGFPTRIYAVAEMVKGGEIVMENVAAELLSEFTQCEGEYIDVWDTLGDVNYQLLMDLYDHYNNIGWKDES